MLTLQHSATWDFTPTNPTTLAHETPHWRKANLLVRTQRATKDSQTTRSSKYITGDREESSNLCKLPPVFKSHHYTPSIQPAGQTESDQFSSVIKVHKFEKEEYRHVNTLFIHASQPGLLFLPTQRWNNYFKETQPGRLHWLLTTCWQQCHSLFHSNHYAVTSDSCGSFSAAQQPLLQQKTGTPPVLA